MPGIQCVAAGAVSEIVVLTADTGNQTSTTEAIISPQLTYLANTANIGTTFMFDFGISCAAGATAQTTPGIVYQLRFGGLAGTLIATTGIITPATLLAASAGRCWGFFTVRTLGATGTVKGVISVEDPRSDRPTSNALANTVRTGKSGAAVTVDLTADKVICVTSKTTVADASAVTFGESGYIAMARA